MLGKLEDRFYDPAFWLEGAWCADWVSELPQSYWVEMIDCLCECWITWLKADQIPAFLDTDNGRRVISDQVFLRLSQASATFVPWLQAACPLKGTKILEIGGGSGSSTAALARAGGVVTTVDIAESYLAIARTRLQALDLSCEQVLASEDWLATDSKTSEILGKAAQAELIICYALFEHLFIEERLRLLSHVRAAMVANPNVRLVVWETPNRFATRDWHTTMTCFPDRVPDALAELYVKQTIPETHSWANDGGPFMTANPGPHWARAGRGMSFHEFTVAFGDDGYEVIHDGYWGGNDHQRHYGPDLAYERALADVFATMTPRVHRGFCRPSLNLVIKLREGRADRTRAAEPQNPG